MHRSRCKSKRSHQIMPYFNLRHSSDFLSPYLSFGLTGWILQTLESKLKFTWKAPIAYSRNRSRHSSSLQSCSCPSPRRFTLRECAESAVQTSGFAPVNDNVKTFSYHEWPTEQMSQDQNKERLVPAMWRSVRVILYLIHWSTWKSMELKFDHERMSKGVEDNHFVKNGRKIE